MNIDDFSIHDVTRSDVWSYLKLNKQKKVIENNEFYLNEKSRRKRRRKDKKYFLAFLKSSLFFKKITKGDETIAFICICPFFFNDINHHLKWVFELDRHSIWFNVFSKYRSNGIMSHYLPKVLELYRDEGYENDLLGCVKKENNPSRNLLIRNGFKFVGENSLSNYYSLKK